MGFAAGGILRGGAKREKKKKGKGKKKKKEKKEKKMGEACKTVQ